MNRFWAFATVAALFLSGVAIGALGMRLIDERRGPFGPQPGPPPPPIAVEELQRELDLSPPQREAVARILQESRRQGDEIRREVRPRLEAHLADTERRLMEVLTPEQRERFDALRRQRRVRPDRLFLGGPPPGQGPPGPPPL
jgi:Spy/CpxP family protein refolding chaperone